MAVGDAELAGFLVRVFRISFSGELAYEIATPWLRPCRGEAIMQAGAAFGIEPYGVEALGLLRIEKGHVAGVGIEWPHHGGRSRAGAHAEATR